MLIGRFSGMCRFVTALVDELARRPDMQIIAMCGAQRPSAWAGRSGIEVLQTDFARPDRAPYRRLRWEQRRIPQLIRRCRADLYHATWNSGVPARCPAPAILTIHDLIPWHEPHTYFTSAFQRLGYRHATRASVRRAAFIVTVSDHVRRDVLRTLSVSPHRTLAIPNGVAIPVNPDRPGHPARNGRHARPIGGGALDGPFALYVGGHEERKNVCGLFRAIAEYWRRFGPTLALHMTGTPASLSPSAAEAYRDLAHKDLVVFLGQPDDWTLAKAYAAAAMLITLSTAEGFGLPVLEAMAQGCPVVAAARASLPEVVGDAGLLVDPDDAPAVAEAMHCLATDSVIRGDCVARGADRARLFTWEAAARRYCDLYRRAARRPATVEPASAVSPRAACPPLPRSA
jgi:glycosyltransferase involved in cell wall biosynthesis